MNLLLNICKMKIKVSFRYVLAMVSNLSGQILQMLLLFFFWTTIYHADQSIMQYVMFSRVVYGFIGGNSVWELSENLKNGSVAVKLTKPMDYFTYTYVEYLATQIANLFLVGIPLSIIAFFISPVDISIVQLILFFISLFLAISISFAFDYNISLICIFTRNTWGISSLRDGLVQIFSGAIIPLAIFPEPISNIIYFLPFAYMIDIPTNIILENDGYEKIIIQLIYCFIMFGFSIMNEKLFMKKMQIQGG